MSADQDVVYASAVSLLDRYRKRELSPVEVTRLLLDRLDALQPKINAFCIVDRDGALAAARESERRWLSGRASAAATAVRNTQAKKLIGSPVRALWRRPYAIRVHTAKSAP